MRTERSNIFATKQREYSVHIGLAYEGVGRNRNESIGEGFGPRVAPSPTDAGCERRELREGPRVAWHDTERAALGKDPPSGLA